jgi:hypothetical protein
LPNDRRALRLVQLFIAEHENPGQLLMQAEFCFRVTELQISPILSAFLATDDETPTTIACAIKNHAQDKIRTRQYRSYSPR